MTAVEQGGATGDSRAGELFNILTAILVLAIGRFRRNRTVAADGTSAGPVPGAGLIHKALLTASVVLLLATTLAWLGSYREPGVPQARKRAECGVGVRGGFCPCRGLGSNCTGRAARRGHTAVWLARMDQRLDDEPGPLADHERSAMGCTLPCGHAVFVCCAAVRHLPVIHGDPAWDCGP